MHVSIFFFLVILFLNLIFLVHVELLLWCYHFHIDDPNSVLQIKTGAPCRSERLAKYNQVIGTCVPLWFKDFRSPYDTIEIIMNRLLQSVFINQMFPYNLCVWPILTRLHFSFWYLHYLGLKWTRHGKRLIKVKHKPEYNHVELRVIDS